MCSRTARPREPLRSWRPCGRLTLTAGTMRSTLPSSGRSGRARAGVRHERVVFDMPRLRAQVGPVDVGGGCTLPGPREACCRRHRLPGSAAAFHANEYTDASAAAAAGEASEGGTGMSVELARLEAVLGVRMVEVMLTVHAPRVGRGNPGVVVTETFPAMVRTRLIYEGRPAFLAADPVETA